MHNCEGISKIKQSEEWTEKHEALGKSPAIILPAARASEEAEIQENAVGTLGQTAKTLQMHLASIISELLNQFCSMHYAHLFFLLSRLLTVSVLPVQSEASTSMSVDKSSMHAPNAVVFVCVVSGDMRASFHAILSQIEWQTLANHYKTVLTMPEIATPKYRSTSTQPHTSKVPGRCCWPQALWKRAGGATRA